MSRCSPWRSVRLQPVFPQRHVNNERHGQWHRAFHAVAQGNRSLWGLCTIRHISSFTFNFKHHEIHASRLTPHARSCAALTATILGAVSFAQSPFIPPDLYGESYKESYALIPNEGQVADVNGNPVSAVKAYTQGSLPQLFMLENAEMSIAWNSVDTLDTTLDTLWSLMLKPYGEAANSNVEPWLYSEKTSFENFYLPQCQNGVLEVYGYNHVVYEDIFPFIDQHLYSGPRGWKMSFVIRPGGNPADLRYKFEGQDSLGVDVWGFLRVVLEERWIVLPEAVAYQVDDTGNIIPLNWTADYTASNNSGTFGFVVDAYDDTRTLILHIGLPPMMGGGPQTPGTCWSTYWGGQAFNQTQDVATDKDGNLFVTGETNSPFVTFPGNQPGLLLYFGARTIALSKVRPDHAPDWTTYYGANTMALWVHDVLPDDIDQVYIVGRCFFSFMLPQVGVTYPWSQGADGYVARFDATTGVMDWSTGFNTILGGAIDLDDDQLVVTGYTALPSIFEPPTQPPGSTYYPHSTGTAHEAYVAKFRLTGDLEWSTYLGGTGWDQAWAVAAGHGQIVVALRTTSDDIPLLTPTSGNPYAQTYGGSNGSMTCYLYRFTADGLHEWGSYYGGSGAETVYMQCVAIDPMDGEFAVVGNTVSDDLPIVPGPGWFIGSLGSNPTTVGSFATRFSGQDDALLWSSYLRPSNAPAYVGIHARIPRYGTNKNLYIGGFADSDLFPWVQEPNLYYSQTLLNDRDGFVLWLDNINTLRWATLFGGAQDNFEENIVSMAYDRTYAVLYATGYTTANVASGQFFPLTDPGFPAYFRSIAIDPQDSFISAFCMGTFTPVNETSLPARVERLHWLGGDLVNCVGFEAGSYEIAVVDMLGRVAYSRTIGIPSSSGQLLRMPPLATGIYSVSIGAAAARVRIEP